MDYPLSFAFVALVLMASVASGFTACAKSGTKEGNEQAAGEAKIDPALARALGRAIQPCLRAHRTPTSSIYSAHLRLEREPSGAVAATFLPGRPTGHEQFEACAVKAIRATADIPVATTATLPVAFDFGPDR